MKISYIIVIFFNFLTMFCEKAFAVDMIVEDKKIKVQNETLIPYFNALKNGDLEIIRQLISKDEYEKYRVLFEKNPTYSDFLKDIYKGVIFQVNESYADGDKFFYQVEFVFPNGMKEVHDVFVGDGIIR